MTYVEWLRVRGCLKCLAIVFAALLVLVCVARLWMLTQETHGALAWVQGMEDSHLSTVSNLTLPDGTKRTIIDNRQDSVHIVIDDRGYQGKHITILERSPEKSRHSNDTFSVGPVEVESRYEGQGKITTIDTDQPEDFGYFVAFATFAALIVATVLGAPFGRENDGHLEIALTKPISREKLGLATIGVDGIGLLASWVLAIAFAFVAQLPFQAPNIVLGPRDGEMIGLGFLAIAAWYAMLCAATASLKRGYGLILGLAWPVAGIVALLAKADLSGSALGQIVHLIVTPLGWIDPFSYTHFGPAFTANGVQGGAMAASLSTDFPLAILTIVYVALAIVQWRRVEA